MQLCADVQFRLPIGYTSAKLQGMEEDSVLSILCYERHQLENG